MYGLNFRGQFASSTRQKSENPGSFSLLTPSFQVSWGLFFALSHPSWCFSATSACTSLSPLLEYPLLLCYVSYLRFLRDKRGFFVILEDE